MPFTHLQVKTSYSLMRSTIKINEMVAKAKDLNMDSLAIADDNVLHGAVEFYKAAKKAGIKPIIGMRLAIESLFYPNQTVMVTLLAKNNAGYKTLINLSTKYQLSQKNLSKLDLTGQSQNLVTIIPTDNQEISKLISKSGIKELAAYLDLFEESYLGIHSQQDSELISRIKGLDLPLIAYDDVRCLEAEESMTLDILDHIERNQILQVDTTERIDYSLKSKEDMTRFFKNNNLTEALENNQKVASSCDWQLELGPTQLPKFEVPDGYTRDSYLKELCLQGLKEYKTNYGQDYIDRLEKELAVISQMGFSDYFLIVWDLMAFAHKNDIEVGFGRGSAVASLVAFTLNITGVDPIKYDLLFERFLNKERFTMPDIDLDFPDNKRYMILDYVRDKYGDAHVAQISTFGTFGAKSSVRDILRVKNKSSQEMSKWSNSIPNQIKITLEDAYNESSALRQIVKESSENTRIFEMAKVIEGLPRNRSTHAAGVVMSQAPLIEVVPLQEGIGDMHNTQFTMNDVEAVGLLKMDFLGLKNLKVLDRCYRYSNYEKKGGLNKKDLPINDPHTLNLFAQGDTNGVFQFESEGIKNVLRKIHPSSIEDIIATNALYRPGPMEQIDSYVKRKHGREPITYPHAVLEPILKLTYGIIVYQEQVMQVATNFAGYSLSEADQLRRTMSKKIKIEMDQGREKFITGSKNNGYSEQVAQEVYNYIARFANYGFNRAHAVAYSMLAYHLAYFKAHMPKSFYAAVLSSDWHNKNKVKVYESEIRKRQINIIGPDINRSNALFSVRDQGIQVGLKMIKGVSDDFVSHIISLRQNNKEFESLRDFCERIDEKYLTHQQIEPLIKTGAFDSIGANRRSMVESLESIIESIHMSGGNLSLFEVTKPRVQVIDEYSDEELVALEREATGFYFSGHPMDKYKSLRKTYKAQLIAEVEQGPSKVVLGRVKNVRKIQTKQNKPMAFVTLADESSEFTLVVFTNQYYQYMKQLYKDNILLVSGKVEFKNGEKQLIVDKIRLADSLAESSRTLYLKFDNLSQQSQDFNQVQKLLGGFGAHIKVVIFDQATNQYKLLKSEFNFNADEVSLEKIKAILGKENCVIK